MGKPHHTIKASRLRTSRSQQGPGIKNAKSGLDVDKAMKILRFMMDIAALLRLFGVF